MKYPKYIIRDYEYVGVFQRIDSCDIPIYRFPGGDTMADEIEIKLGADTKEQAQINEILYRLHLAGGCNADTDYDEGWDSGIDEAIEIVEKITGTKITDLLERL